MHTSLPIYSRTIADTPLIILVCIYVSNYTKGDIFLAFTDKKSQTAPLGTVWDFYDNRKYIPHDMQSSYLRSLVDLRRFELPTPTMRMWCAPNCATSPYHKNYTAGFSLCQGKRNPCTQFQLCDIINKKTVRRKQYVPWRRLPWLFFEYHWFGRTVRPCNFAVTAIHMPAATQVRVAASFINWNLPY